MKTAGLRVCGDFAEGEGRPQNRSKLGFIDKGEDGEKGVWGLKFLEKTLQNQGGF